MANEKPAHKTKVGRTEVARWDRELEKDGKKFTMSNFSVSCSYQDKEGNWQNGTSFSLNDIPKLILALQKEYEESVLKEKETEE